MRLRQAIATASDPASVMDRVLVEALVLVPSAEGAAVLLCTGPNVLDCTAAAGNLAGFVGTSISGAGTLSTLAMRTGVTLRAEDARSDPRVDPGLAARFGILSAICVPLHWGVEDIGVVLITSDEASAFQPADEATVAGLAPFVSTVIGAAVDLARCTTELLGIRQGATVATIDPDDLSRPSETALALSAFVANVVSPGIASESAVRDCIEQTLAGTGPTIVLQPIISLSTGMVVEVEALSRFAGLPERGPDRWFAEAASIGLGRQLELRAIERALDLLPLIPGPVRMAVNAGPDTFCSSELIELLETSTPDRVVVELTEHVGIADYPELHRACKRLRAIGAEVAIDDTGTGFASLSLVLEVAPEIIKLDRELTADIDLDPVKRALASALVTFGADIGATVIAEGIETSDQLEILTELGIDYGQGFFLGRPGTVEDLVALIRAEGGREPMFV
jgi:EAL domain-containing protein (putative c-di-GMP-specific phosphodiesterase class I)